MLFVFLFQAEDGIRDLVRSRGLGDVYKRQLCDGQSLPRVTVLDPAVEFVGDHGVRPRMARN